MKSRIIILLFLFIYGCGNENIPAGGNINPFENFRYPFSDNINWFYKYNNIIHNIRPDSIRQYITTDTIKGTGISIWSGDTTINGVTGKIFRSEHNEPNHSHSTIELFVQTDSGLISTYSGNTGRSFGPFSANLGNKFLFNGNIYESLNEIITETNISQAYTAIKYPVNIGDEWFLQRLSGNFNFYKKYIDVVNLSVPAGTFECIKIKKIVKNDSGVENNNYEYYDYLSVKGILKRDYNLKNIGFLNSQGEVIGYFDIKEEIEVNLISGF
ncbi:MAG TPA: hypothetical protein DEP28_04645 [Bacteroidetes bacterium]|nr:hypothetical protein [Bacteroidota bacterium]HCN38129.1 hypothetical protein [Bacteroidota bacterium]